MPRLSNGSLAELALTAIPPPDRLDAFGFGANMSCLLKRDGESFSVAAYWRKSNEIACRLDPSKLTKVKKEGKKSFIFFFFKLLFPYYYYFLSLLLSQPMIAGDYDISVVFAPGLGEFIVPGQRVAIVDGARYCAKAQTCNTCDKSFCVYCADSQACVPGLWLLGELFVMCVFVYVFV